MTDPLLPPPSGVPPVPVAPSGVVPAPQGYPQASSVQAPPPGAYRVPVGGYASAQGGYAVPSAPQPLSPLLGILALIFSLVAAVVTPVVVGVAAFEIGRRIPEAISSMGAYMADPNPLAFLSPARDQVLWAELSFWTGTALGIAAIVIGIIAIRRRQGRVQGVVALVASAIAPVLFFVVLSIALSAGAAAGTAELLTTS